MSAAWPDPSHVCTGEPTLVAWTHQTIKRLPGATPDEIVELVLRIEDPDHSAPAYDRRMDEARIRDIIAASQRATGARRIVSIDQVHEAEAALRKAGQPAGERSIAKRLGETRATVHRVLEDAGER